jgi:hypothetical protein
MERVRVLRAARDGTIVILATVAVVIWQDHREADLKLLPADVTLTAPVGPGTDQIQFLVRGAGCDQADTSERGYKEPKDRVRAPTRHLVKDALVITYMVEDPGKYACHGFDPGVPRTVTLELPLGDRRLLDGTKHPPAPFKIGPPRTLPFGVVPEASPSATATATRGPE